MGADKERKEYMKNYSKNTLVVLFDSLCSRYRNCLH